MTQVPAEERRAQARAVVLGLLGQGRRYENVSLRDVARELDVPLSTLTYVYSWITDLLDDFATFIDDRMLLSRVGPGGLQAELTSYVDELVAMLMADPGNRPRSRSPSPRAEAPGRGPSRTSACSPGGRSSWVEP